MKIAIVDDEKPARNELGFLIRESAPQAAICEFADGESALKALAHEVFDLICIDINLGDISGTTLAAAARRMQPKVAIVFATAYNNFAEKAFEVDALYYLLKPFAKEKVKQMLLKYEHKNEIKVNPQFKVLKIPVTMEKKIVLLDIQSIVYIEAQNRVCIIHTKGREYRDNSPLSYFEEKLSGSGFFRIQKSYIINLKYVLEIYPWFNNAYCVKMEGFPEENLTVSRTQIKILKQLIGI